MFSLFDACLAPCETSADQDEFRVAAARPARPPWLARVGPRQMQVPPPCWSVTIWQIKELIDYCRTLPEWRNDITMHEFVDVFVKPWTAGTGASYALLRNTGPGSTAVLRPAEVMVSHTWRESVDDFVGSLVTFFAMRGISDDTPLFICSLALYQSEDRFGPSVAAQIALEPEPFIQVIQSPEMKVMVAVHVRGCDLYSRLWCVREMDEAQKNGVPVLGAMAVRDSTSYASVRTAIAEAFSEGPSLMVNTRLATCSSPEDEQRLRRQIEASERRDPYRKLDKRIADLRMKMLLDAFLWYGGGRLGFRFEGRSDHLRFFRSILASGISRAPKTRDDALAVLGFVEKALLAARSGVGELGDVAYATVSSASWRSMGSGGSGAAGEELVKTHRFDFGRGLSRTHKYWTSLARKRTRDGAVCME